MTAWTSKDYVLSFFLLCFCFCFVFNYIKYKLRILFKKNTWIFLKTSLFYTMHYVQVRAAAPLFPPFYKCN